MIEQWCGTSTMEHNGTSSHSLALVCRLLQNVLAIILSLCCTGAGTWQEDYQRHHCKEQCHRGQEWACHQGRLGTFFALYSLCQCQAENHTCSRDKNNRGLPNLQHMSPGIEHMHCSVLTQLRDTCCEVEPLEPSLSLLQSLLWESCCPCHVMTLLR